MASRPPHPDAINLPQSAPSVLVSSDRRDDTDFHHGSPDDPAATIAAARGLEQHHSFSPTSAQPIPAPDSASSYTGTAPGVTSPSSSIPQLFLSPLQFCAYTIAPSPPPPLPARSAARSPSSSIQDPFGPPSHGFSSQRPAHLGRNALQLQTEFRPGSPPHSNSHNGFTTPARNPKPSPILSLRHTPSASSLRSISRTPSFKAGSLSGAFGSASAASSTVASPVIAAMGDVTPLPSPLLSTHSPGPWKRHAHEASALRLATDDSLPGTSPEDPKTATTPTNTKFRGYTALSSHHAAGILAENAVSERPGYLAKPKSHTRNRSISDYKPDPMLIPKRMSTVSGSRVKADHANLSEPHMRRERNLSEARGLTPIEKPPTPPPSESSLSATESCSSSKSSTASLTSTKKHSPPEYFEAYGRHDRKRRRWRAIRQLGQGTFSRVMLATSQTYPASDNEDISPSTVPVTPDLSAHHERRSLVAVKICEHGALGGASEERIEMSLKRELEIMQCIRHPSLVNLKAWSIEPSRAILVLSYYPGGDLFEVASKHRELLSPSLLSRMFAELVGAISYLHDQKIVHRDIKLENVLVNLTPEELCVKTVDWATYPYPVITLGDLGLSRHVQDDEKLETRCGSDDYAAPEVIMGQPYDGRATDAWSLGVLLYALLEGRLPFDPHPGVGDYAMQMRMRSRTSHRIARVEWRWIEYGVKDGEDGEGDHEADLAKFQAKGLTGAMEVVEGLLKRARSRWPVTKVAETKWVSGAIQVPGGIKFREEEEGEEVF
ncbi:kinase-like domain-containing protein [Triangularia setosa]|uniref:Kinase-like domain-containing protein n=1 Tax=Triangularia setosa TaxID=2587417 RepID=A0AAN6WGP6_9PEZI|nr:kinase-like domain-containing protein [Podospora setosa]